MSISPIIAAALKQGADYAVSWGDTNTADALDEIAEMLEEANSIYLDPLGYTCDATTDGAQRFLLIPIEASQ